MFVRKMSIFKLPKEEVAVVLRNDFNKPVKEERQPCKPGAPGKGSCLPSMHPEKGAGGLAWQRVNEVVGCGLRP